MKPVISILFILFSFVPGFSRSVHDETRNIAAFCTVWGFLKYYHPTVAKGQMDWDSVFITRCKDVASLQSKADISQYYINWITGLGKVKKCNTCKPDIPGTHRLNLDLAWLSDTSFFSKALIDQLQFILLNRNKGSNYYVGYNLPVRNTSFEHEKPYKDSIFPSRELRLLGLARYWNIIAYFFPYKYLVGKDWNTVLVEMIPKFRDCTDTVSYHLAMLELTVAINDSHALFSTTYTNQYFGLKWAPFRYAIIENKVVVTGFYNDSLCAVNDIRLGDVFVQVGNETIAGIISKNAKYIGASNEAVKLRNSYYAIFNGPTDSVIVTYERDGITRQKTLYRYNFRDFSYKDPGSNSDTCAILDGNIGYINLGLLQLSQTERCLNALKNTKAIIFDVRNYPNGTMYRIADFLNAEKKFFAKFTYPDITFPGLFHYTKPVFCGRKNKSPYPGKVVLLFNEQTQSHAEFTIMALQTVPDVISIGSQTAGADGNVSEITFPGGYRTYMSGIGVYYPDGRETQRTGILPDIEIKPTIKGVQSGRDEVLEKAIEIINK